MIHRLSLAGIVWALVALPAAAQDASPVTIDQVIDALTRTAVMTFEKKLIHGDSGVGTQFVATDVDGDGRTDVVTSNKKGVFVHLQR